MSQLLNVKNIAFIRSATEFSGDLGVKIAEALESIALQASNGQQQTNANPTGTPQPPPAPDNLHVMGQNGHFSIAIAHDAPFYRGINYSVEHADNPQFTNPHAIDMGASRNHNVFLGNVTRYWRAVAAYGNSGPSSPVYMGGFAQPTPVQGGGDIGGPAFTASQGSGTGRPGVGLQGPGKEPYRPVKGAPPIR